MTNNPNTPGLLPDVPEYTAQIVHLWITEESLRIISQQKKPLDILRHHLMQSDELRQGLIDQILSEESVSRVLQGHHAPVTDRLLSECEAIHQEVSKNQHNIVYQGCYILLLPTIVAYRAKYPKAKEMGEIEILCTILYNTMMARLTEGNHFAQHISSATSKLLQQISALFALVDQEYHKRYHLLHQ